MFRLLFLLIMLLNLSSSYLRAETVLITGANRGLGLEFARQYKQLGWTVIGTARAPERASELNALDVRTEQLDVTSDDSVAALAQRLDGVAIDLLINNAGILRGRERGIKELNFDDMTLTFAVNSVGPMRVIQALLPNLKKGKRKQIVGITSQLASIAMNSGGMYAYRASKTALNQLNRTLSLELGPHGFTCVVMHPGWVRTDMGGERAPLSPADSVGSMIKVLGNLTPNANGRYLNFDGGELPW